jgi:hypothetical protein
MFYAIYVCIILMNLELEIILTLSYKIIDYSKSKVKNIALICTELI